MIKIYIDEERCKGCCLCIDACPKKIISANGEKLNSKGFHPVRILEIEKCIGCAFCATICPDCAIEIEKQHLEVRSQRSEVGG